MKELIKMVVVLTIISSLSGGVLAYVNDLTIDQRDYQNLINNQAPTLKTILEGASNDPLESKFEVKYGPKKMKCYVGVFDGKPNTVVYETYKSGYADKVYVMVGINLETDKIVGIGVTKHTETKGYGADAKEKPDLKNQFPGLDIMQEFKVKKEGGTIDAISGATITSAAVCKAVTEAGIRYKELKPELETQVKQFSN